jgi:hypothetical protein
MCGLHVHPFNEITLRTDYFFLLQKSILFCKFFYPKSIEEWINEAFAQAASVLGLF